MLPLFLFFFIPLHHTTTLLSLLLSSPLASSPVTEESRATEEREGRKKERKKERKEKERQREREERKRGKRPDICVRHACVGTPLCCVCVYTCVHTYIVINYFFFVLAFQIYRQSGQEMSPPPSVPPAGTKNFLICPWRVQGGGKK